MMVEQLAAERAALDQMEPIWRAQGYQVVRELPPSSDMPAFMGAYRPDAMAIGREPGLMIEVINPLLPSTTTKIRQLQGLFAGRKDWKLEVVYMASDATLVNRTPNDEIHRTLEQAMAVAEIDPRAGLLLGWGVLEAIGRAVNPKVENKVISPRSLIDLLVSQGYLRQSDGDALRSFANMRNALIHGQLDLRPSLAEVRSLIELARSIPLPN